jgi:division protein CdvB (Snf7/Vps24/ESCRT-III family)
MSENNTPQEILENNSSSLMVTTITPAAATTTAAAAIATTTITDEYKKVKMDQFNLNLHNSNIQNCHSSQFSHDSDFHLIKYNIPLRPKIKQIQYRINNEIIKLQNIFHELKTQDEELIKKLDISIKENNIQYSSLISSELNGIRKSIRAIWTSRIVLDTLHNQICSISSFKDLVEKLAPSLTVMKSIRSLLISHVRESDHEFKNILDLLCDVLFNAGQLGGYLINFKIANNTALDITDDAIFKAENKIKIEFLPIPKVIT